MDKANADEANGADTDGTRGGASGEPGRSDARPIVLDTNAILLPFTEGTRLEESLEALVEEFSLHVPTSVVSELQQLAKNHGKVGIAARAALKLAQRYVREATGRMGDDGILEVARRLRGTVLTNDRRLQLECQRSGLQVIVARERGRLAFLKAGSKGTS